MALRDLLRQRRRDELRPLSEDDVRHLQRVQRAAAKRVRVLRRGRASRSES